MNTTTTPGARLLAAKGVLWAAVPGSATQPGPLTGRDDNLEYLIAFVDQAAISGGTLLLLSRARHT